MRDVKEGDRVKVIYEGEVTSKDRMGNVYVQTGDDCTQRYYGCSAKSGHVTVEVLENLKPGEVYIDNVGDIAQRTEGNGWHTFGDRMRYDDDWMTRPLRKLADHG
jgi:hypothetical protein